MATPLAQRASSTYSITLLGERTGAVVTGRRRPSTCTSTRRTAGSYNRGLRQAASQQLCVKAGAAVSEVLEATGMDPQYGPGFSGASTIRADRDRYLYRVVAQALVRDRLGASVASKTFHYGKL